MKNRELDIIDEYVDRTSSDSEKTEIKLLLKDAIEYWAENWRGMGIYSRYSYVISDQVIFNESKDKVLLLTSFIKKSKHANVDLFSAVKEGDEWSFRHRGLPGFNYEYDDELREGHPFTTSELLEDALEKMIRDGLVQSGKVNQEYINTKWFSK